MMAPILAALTEGHDLTDEQVSSVMGMLLAGNLTDAQTAGFLVGLAAKGISAKELIALTTAMLSHAEPLDVPEAQLDIVGTGGDGSNSVNISTMAAVAAAATGVCVVKHGNRAASSASGSADVLRAAGIRLDLPPSDVAAVARAVGITFAFAQTFHPAMRHVAPVRKELGIRTPFNWLGPLTNPAQPPAYVLGVADPGIGHLMADVLASRDQRGFVVCGPGGMDELGISGHSTVWNVAAGTVHETHVDPARLGLHHSTADALAGGDAEHNARIMRETLGGTPGPVADAVVLNAAAGLVAVHDMDRVGDEVSGDVLHEAFAQRIAEVRQAINGGAAAGLLTAWIEDSASRAPLVSSSE